MARTPLSNGRRVALALAASSVIALVALGAGPALAASATWSPPVSLSPGQGTIVESVTAPDGTITAVIESYTTGIMIVSSTDAGATWQTPVALGSGGDAAFRATIGVTSIGVLAVAWVEDTAGSRSIRVSVSADGGSTWSAPTSLPTVSTYVDDPAIGSSTAVGFTVVWTEDSFDKLSSSTIDGGATWSSSVVITENMNSYGTTTFAVMGIADIVAVYQEFDGLAALYSIHSRRSTDGGLTWEPAVMVTPAWSGGLGNSLYAIAVSPVPGSIVVFWTHGRAGGGDALFAATSTDNGSTWGPAIEVSSGADSLRNFAPVAVDGVTAGVVWHQSSGSGYDVFYAEVELGATSASIPVPIDPTSTLFYDRQPTLTAFGTSRVATWFAEGMTASANTYSSAVSCDGGATWRPSTTITAGADVSSSDAVSALSGTVLTAFWGEYDAVIDDSVPYSSVIDDPCSVPVALDDGGELAATGAREGAIGVFLAGLGMLAAGLAALGVRRAAGRG